MNDKARFIKKRKHARDKAMQALYQWQMSGEDLDWIRDMYLEEQGVASGDEAYFLELLYQVPKNLAAIERAFHAHVQGREDHLDPIENSILRIATYELMFHLEIPYRAVINEAINLARAYGADDGHKFVNGVLDPVARDLRPVETALPENGKRERDHGAG